MEGVLKINSTYLSHIARRRGYATLAYKTIISQGNVLESDTDRSEGADALWLKLRKDPELDIQFHRVGVDEEGYFVASIKKG